MMSAQSTTVHMSDQLHTSGDQWPTMTKAAADPDTLWCMFIAANQQSYTLMTSPTHVETNDQSSPGHLGVH